MAKNIKKYIKLMIVCLLLLILGVNFIKNELVYAYTYTYTFEHKMDMINMSNNTITYNYLDYREGQSGLKKRTYTISSNWISDMAIHHSVNTNEGVTTDTTMYGPYVWLPAGRYKVKVDFTNAGGHAFECWDVAVNFGHDGSPTKRFNYEGNVEIGNGAYIYNANYHTSPNEKYLEYEIETTGDASDYEFRLFFNGDLGHNLSNEVNRDINVLTDFVKNISVESMYFDNVTLDAQGGSIDNNAVKTQWGKARKNLEASQIPTKEGYEFEGWYAYSEGINVTNERAGLKFDEDSAKVKIWNPDGTPAIESEVSYNDYTVYAQWKRKSYTQDVYVRFQNEDGSFGDYYNEYYNNNTGKYEKYSWDVDYEEMFSFTEDNIKNDSKWDSNIYDFPQTYKDGTALEYKVTQNNTKYIDIYRNDIFEYDIVFNDNADSKVTGVPESMHIDYGQKVRIPSDIPERKMFSFSEWNTKADGTGQIIMCGQEYDQLAAYNNQVVTLYAQWKPLSFGYIKAASNMYGGTIIKRTSNDNEWYNTIGKKNVNDIKNLQKEECYQVWQVSAGNEPVRLK